jgi:hypothetical protein
VATKTKPVEDGIGIASQVRFVAHQVSDNSTPKSDIPIALLLCWSSLNHIPIPIASSKQFKITSLVVCFRNGRVRNNAFTLLVN